VALDESFKVGKAEGMLRMPIQHKGLFAHCQAAGVDQDLSGLRKALRGSLDIHMFSGALEYVLSAGPDEPVFIAKSRKHPVQLRLPLGSSRWIVFRSSERIVSDEDLRCVGAKGPKEIVRAVARVCLP
jgi:hypothetical protein